MDENGKMPGWAIDLTLRVGALAGRSDLPCVTWRTRHKGWNDRRTATFSSGTTYDSGRIVITAGRSRKDQRLVLLHELAHWLTPEEHHGPRFWEVAWALYYRFGVDIRYAQGREARYRKGSVPAQRRVATILGR